MDWLMTNCHSILLVGEANFSFAVNVAQHLCKKVRITASSFETEHDVRGRLQGGDNVALLQELGAEVLFQVDATKLHITDPIQQNQYDAIIFNFPHTGRKAGINKNRQLLKEFFESCCNLLTPAGRVIVSLCNGQGGTPMDTPQREWNNSWQIVAMATYGGFILRDAMPFTSAFPVEYCNTGYRSQNKKFLNESAVTHIFEKGPLWSLPTGAVDPLLMSTHGGLLYTCPDDLVAFKTRKLLREANHPLHKMALNITAALKLKIPNLYEKDITKMSEILLEKHSQCSNEIQVEVKSKVKGHPCQEASEKHSQGQNEIQVEVKSAVEGQPCQKDNESLLGVKGQRLNEASELNVNSDVLPNVTVDNMLKGLSDDKNVDNLHDGQAVDNLHGGRAVDNLHGGQAVNTLVSSLLQHTPVILQRDEPPCPVVMTSQVYHKCPIDKNLQVLPIMHQILVIHPHLEKALWDRFEDVTVHILKSVINSGIEIVEEQSDFDLVHGLNKCEMAEVDLDTKNVHEYSLNQHILCALPESVHISDVSSINAKGFVQNIGICGKLTFNSKTAKFILLNLDYLVMCKFNIDDIRLLWSEDPLQWDHTYYKENASQDSKTTCIETISKFPPRYIHDLSFWTDEQFDKLASISVVWRIAGSIIEELKLLDMYKDGQNGRVGLCYRLVYRSIDKALSKDQARQIQSVVRETVKKELSVDLR